MKSHTLLAVNTKPGPGFHTDQAFAQRADNPQMLRAITTMKTGNITTGTVGFANGRQFVMNEGELVIFFGELVRRQLKFDGYVPLTHASPFEGGRGVEGRRTGVRQTTKISWGGAVACGRMRDGTGMPRAVSLCSAALRVECNRLRHCAASGD